MLTISAEINSTKTVKITKRSLKDDARIQYGKCAFLEKVMMWEKISNTQKM